MKRFILSSVVLVAALSIASMAFATTFGEVPLGTTDPTIGGESFWAGDPSVPNDTYVDDSWSAGNPYLMNGYDDGTGSSPGLYDSFIGVSPSALFGSVALDILSEYSLPGGTTLWLQGRLGGSDVESTSLFVSDNSYHPLSLTFASGADTLYIYDNLNAFNLGEAFHIDNFTSTAYVTPPPPPPHGVPEPGTLMLLVSGISGVWFLRKRI